MTITWKTKDGILRGYIDNKLVLVKTKKVLKVSCNKKQWGLVKALITNKFIGVPVLDENEVLDLMDSLL